MTSARPRSQTYLAFSAATTFGGTQEQHIWWHNHFGIGYNIFGGTQERHLLTAGVIYWMGYSDIASQFLKLSGVYSYEFGMLAIF